MLINWDQRERGRKRGKKSERVLKQHQSHSCPQILPVHTVPTHQSGGLHTDCIWFHTVDKLMLINQTVISWRTVCKRLLSPATNGFIGIIATLNDPLYIGSLNWTSVKKSNGSRLTAGHRDHMAVCNQNRSQKTEGSWDSPTWCCALSPRQIPWAGRGCSPSCVTTSGPISATISARCFM